MNNRALEEFAVGAENASHESERNVHATDWSLVARAAWPMVVVVLMSAGINLWDMLSGAVAVVGYATAMTRNVAISSVLGLWMTLGVLPIRWQVPLALAGLSVVLGTLLACLLYGSRIAILPALAISDLLQLGVFASMAAVGWYFRRARAWRLAPRRWLGQIPPPRAVRFSLRQMFVAIVIAGGILAVRTDRMPYHVVVTGLFVGFLTAIVAMPTLAILLGTFRGRMASIVDVTVLSLAAALVGLMLYFGRSSGDTRIVLEWYVWLAGSLGWLRLCGLRLVRRAAEGSFTLVP
jgi:hypothetical protein